MAEYYKTSQITGKTYNLFGGVITIMNIDQAEFYYKHGVMPVDIEFSKSKKNGRTIIAFLYNKEDTKQVYDEWCKNNEVNRT